MYDRVYILFFQGHLNLSVGLEVYVVRPETTPQSKRSLHGCGPSSLNLPVFLAVCSIRASSILRSELEMLGIVGDVKLIVLRFRLLSDASRMFQQVLDIQAHLQASTRLTSMPPNMYSSLFSEILQGALQTEQHAMTAGRVVLAHYTW